MTRPESTESNQNTNVTAEEAIPTTATPDQASQAPEQEMDVNAEAPNSLEEQLTTAKAEAAAHYDRYVRAVADHENFRKRTAREKDELRQYATSRVLEDLLPVLDNLGLGLAAARQPNADLKSLVEGVGMVQSQLKSTLEQNGLKELNPAGMDFDAHQHEALSQMPSEEVPEGKVITVVRTGYSLNGRLLRPAAVIVSSGAAKPETKA
ncbi:MAG: nucleotide exchange factor GrpE [Cephaloticoccus sp.]|nr:nucleotide exchange factor GrpE [Cephaloticoccus sp.]MCF7758949.1 nucleotide exchange factor GrpE [Cephaloticoccus sp.]